MTDNFTFFFVYSDYDIIGHDGTRTIKEIVTECWSKTYGNVSATDSTTYFRQKRNFEDKLAVEAQKLPDKMKPAFYSVAFNVATDKILTHFEVKVTKRLTLTNCIGYQYPSFNDPI